MVEKRLLIYLNIVKTNIHHQHWKRPSLQKLFPRSMLLIHLYEVPARVKNSIEEKKLGKLPERFMTLFLSQALNSTGYLARVRIHLHFI